MAVIDFTGTPPEAAYTEGPWLWKKNNRYYLAWASRCCPEGIGYAMSDSPTGPWKCKGTIMDPSDRTGISYASRFSKNGIGQRLSSHPQF